MYCSFPGNAEGVGVSTSNESSLFSLAREYQSHCVVQWFCLQNPHCCASWMCYWIRYGLSHVSQWLLRASSFLSCIKATDNSPAKAQWDFNGAGEWDQELPQAGDLLQRFWATESLLLASQYLPPQTITQAYALQADNGEALQALSSKPHRL